MINFIIFSKDRAQQCELFLRSCKYYFKEYDNTKIKVLYTYSDEEYKKGYDILISEYPEILFYKENSFKKDLLYLLDEEELLTMFAVDDIVWKNHFSLESGEISELKKNKNILCLSLRLHPNLTYCYAANIKMNKPKLNNNKWEWKTETGDFNYPLSLDLHVYRTKDIYYLFKILNYKNPNDLEGQLARFNLSEKHPLMSCFNDSIVLNNPCNKVQTNNPNKHGNISAEYLNQEFLKGKRIDLEPFKGFKNISCHQEIPIKLI